MITVAHISEVRSHVAAARREGKTVGFVPTMGYLHDGHCSLIRRAKEAHGFVVLSIFVNPTQFAPTEDLDRYPRDLERDARLAREAGCDLIFVPPVEEMYPAGFSTVVGVDGLSSVLEGEFRPTHFKGVTTVVMKLINIVGADTVYFGQKDAQQSVIIRRMAEDLNIPGRIEIVPTMREPDGLAMSSRNVYLTPEQRANAPVLYRALQLAQQQAVSGERNAQRIIDAMRSLILQHGPTQIDYIRIVGAADLQDRPVLTPGETVLVPLAVRFGTTRLIDNIVFTM
ncbi:MAG: pantoate--beta-alanine ligase [Bacteroidetes bacterium]|nr:pantoate--beta-alanine ligase [Bacteroidota bacterium]